MLPIKRSRPMKSVLLALFALALLPAAGAQAASSSAALSGSSSSSSSAGPVSSASSSKLPTLTIAAQTCHTGPTPADRWVLVSATATKPAKSARVALRFQLQQQVTAKKWQTLTAQTLGTWETSKAGKTGLQITKRIDSLQDATTYRMLVQARGANSRKRATTRVVAMYVPCKQVPAEATLQITPLTVRATDSGGAVVRAQLSNLGQQSSAPFVFSATSSAGVLVGSVSEPALDGQSSRTVLLPVSQCVGQLTLAVAESSAVPSTTDADATTTVNCPGA
jgi:hypothetical protein